MAPKVLLVSPCRYTDQIQDRLCRLGCEILRADNGLRFISHLEVEDPDVVIMDAPPAWCDLRVLYRTVRASSPAKPVFVLSREDGQIPDLGDVESAQVFCMPRQVGQLVRKVRECARR